MSSNPSKRGTLISKTILVDPETGDYYESNKTITLPEMVKILDKNNGFLKVRKRLFALLKVNELGYLLKLINSRIDYNSGKLRIGGKGKKPIAINKHNQIAELLDISVKTAKRITSVFIENQILIKIDDGLYINPSYVQFGGFIKTDVVIKMIEKDHEIKKYIPQGSARLIDDFKKMGKL